MYNIYYIYLFIYIYLYIYIHISQLLHLFIQQRILYCFHTLAVGRNAAINIRMQISYRVVFVSFGYIFKSAIAGSCSISILIF